MPVVFDTGISCTIHAWSYDPKRMITKRSKVLTETVCTNWHTQGTGEKCEQRELYCRITARSLTDAAMCAYTAIPAVCTLPVVPILRSGSILSSCSLGIST